MFPLVLIQCYWFHHSVSIKHSVCDLVAFYTEPASMRHRITRKLVQTKDTTFNFSSGTNCRKAHVCADACFCLAIGWAAQALLVGSVWPQHLPESGWIPESTGHPGCELAPWSACICISRLDFRGAGVEFWIAKAHVTSYSSRVCSVLILQYIKQIN